MPTGDHWPRKQILIRLKPKWLTPLIVLLELAAEA
jgi:hypothetical protein